MKIYLSLATILAFKFVETSPSLGTKLGQMVQSQFSGDTSTKDVCVFHLLPSDSGLNDLMLDFIVALNSARSIFTLNNLSPVFYRECSITLVVVNKPSLDCIFRFLLEMKRNCDVLRAHGKLLVVSDDRSMAGVQEFLLWVDAGSVFSDGVYVTSFDLLDIGNMYSTTVFNIDLVEEKPSLEAIGNILWSKTRINAKQYPWFIFFYYTFPFILLNSKGCQVQEPNQKLMKLFLSLYNSSILWNWPQTEVEVDDWYIFRQVKFLPNVQSMHVKLVPTMSFSGFCFLVPEKPIKRYFNYLLQPFSESLWVTIACFLVLTSLLIWKTSCRNLLTMFFFGSSISEHKLHRIERTCMLIISIILFLLCESYLSKMMSFMLNTKYERHIETIEELITSNVQLCIDPSEEVFFNSIKPGLSHKLHLQKTSRKLYPNCSYCHSCDWARYFVRSKENVEPVTGLNRFYIMKEQLFGNVTFHMFPRNDLLAELFERFSQQLFNAGIWQYWLDNYWRGITNHPQEVAVAILKTQDLASLWMILRYGSVISLVVLLLEIVVHAGISKFKIPAIKR